MKIYINSLLSGAKNARGTVIIIDVFRAFSTAAFAFVGGAEKIILVNGAQKALELKKKGWQITKEDITKGLLNVIKNTGLLGRWQKLKEKPLIICDIAHNKDGINAIKKGIAYIPIELKKTWRRKHYLMNESQMAFIRMVNFLN